MTEQEWLTSSDPEVMLQYITGPTGRTGHLISDRKMRLFVAAWYRTAPPHREEHEVQARQVEEGTRDYQPVLAACGRRHQWSGDWSHMGPTGAALLREIVGNPFRPVTLPGGKRTCPRCEGYSIGKLLHCPDCDNRGSIVDPCPWLTWNDGAVVKMAQAIFQDRAFEQMPILADALEDAGCQDEAILRHCRGQELCPAHPTSDLSKHKGEWVQGKGIWSGMSGPKGPIPCDRCGDVGWIPLRGPHACGCWVLDLLLGKE